MNLKRQTTRELQKELLRKNSYKEAVRVMEKFLETKRKKRKRESIKINPYAEYPWTSYPELTSNRWAETG